MTRELNTIEVQYKFIKQVRALIDYWENESREPNSIDKLNGLAFSMLSMLDGCHGEIPGFIVAPNPHESDKDYHIQNNHEFYYPENHMSNINCDIGGGLHDAFSARPAINPIRFIKNKII